MKSAKLAVFATAALIVTNALGDWNDAGKVTRIHSGHGDLAYGKTFAFSTAVHISVADCNNTAGYFVNEDLTSASRIYATLLLAYATEKQISIYTTGKCLDNRPEVNAVQIKDTPYF
jgi:hypothetical protein